MYKCTVLLALLVACVVAAPAPSYLESISAAYSAHPASIIHAAAPIAYNAYTAHAAPIAYAPYAAPFAYTAHGAHVAYTAPAVSAVSYIP
ncbi:PREDICTED: pupal cuticle protein C1B [Wasmannia auropunctata]|uniref:pupal cuticle protein C1B n=1 Tax=Wasmannia auropunctata TaxID=64793 RepID=UPI0005EDC3E2|nr:PREDICTED: pupal cuticle protein C1B [Wasmannia auropunctata]